MPIKSNMQRQAKTLVNSQNFETMGPKTPKTPSQAATIEKRKAADVTPDADSQSRKSAKSPALRNTAEIEIELSRLEAARKKKQQLKEAIEAAEGERERQEAEKVRPSWAQDLKIVTDVLQAKKLREEAEDEERENAELQVSESFRS